MPGKCVCGTPFYKGKCPNCGEATFASQILQLIGLVVKEDGRFLSTELRDWAEKLGVTNDRGKVAAALISLREWEAITGPEWQTHECSLTGKGRRMIEVKATWKNFPLTR